MPLYKYKKIGDIRNNILDNYLLSLLENGELYLSNPRDFNDPFDCSFEFEFCDDIDFLKSFYLNRGYTKESVDEIFIKQTIESIKDDLKLMLSNTDVARVYCLSESYDNPLMWAHYAQEHYGICIGFKTYVYDGILHLNISDNQYNTMKKKGAKNLVPVFDVRYVNDKLNPIELNRKGNELLFLHALTKADYWNYEKEKRILFALRSLLKNPIHIKKNEICEIIFGLRTPIRMKKKVINIVKNIKNIEIFEMEMTVGTYKIIRKKIFA